jgi:hypothetical protein
MRGTSKAVSNDRASSSCISPNSHVSNFAFDVILLRLERQRYFNMERGMSFLVVGLALLVALLAGIFFDDINIGRRRKTQSDPSPFDGCC